MAITYVGVGTAAQGTGGLSPGLPAGVANGDYLLLHSGARNETETVADPSGWTLIANDTGYGAHKLWARIADGSASDTPTLNWSASSNSFAQILAFRGVEANAAGAVAASAVGGSTTNDTDIPNPALTVPEDNCVVIGCGAKGKTATSNGATMTSPTGLNNRVVLDWDDGNVIGWVIDYTIQTAAANIAASNWNQSINESRAYGSIVVALSAAAAAGHSHPLSGSLAGTFRGKLG